jgi:hypothetical protein
MTITLNAVRCLKCKDVIVSEYRHDFKWCSCGNVAVDGGHSYTKRCFKTDEWEELSKPEQPTVNPFGRPINWSRRTYHAELSAKYGVPVETVRRHIKLFTRAMPEDGRLCVINDIKRAIATLNRSK